MASHTADESLKHGAQQIEEVFGAHAIADAKHASDAEHNTPLMQVIKKNRKAIAWSMVMSMTVVMEGYDTILMSSFFAYPSFTEKFGAYNAATNDYQLSGAWQTALNNASNVGIVPGIFLNGWLAAKYGYRKVIIVALFFLNAFIFITFFAPNKPVLVVGQILCGFSWGVFATIGPAYASEIVPLQLRGYLTSYVNLCWAIGQFIAAGVLKGLVARTDQWSYRIPFAVQWAWPVPLMIACFFAPESPWYMVRNNRLDEAQHILKRISTNTNEDEIKGTLAMMVHTVEIETQLDNEASQTSYFQCFKGTDRRRTEICCMTFMGQLFSGSCFAYTPTYFFQQAGIKDTVSYSIGLGGTAVAFCGTIASWFILAHVGRRKIYTTGMGVLCTLLLVIGIVSTASKSDDVKWVAGALTVVWLFTYSLSVGPVAYTIVSETSAIRVRAKTVCLARNSYALMNIVCSTLESYFMNPTEWNLKGKTAFFWFATSFCTFVWAYFRLPEAKDRTYEEMDLLFTKGVSARQFAHFKIDAYAGAGLDSKTEILYEEKVVGAIK
ncbi:putative sugar transporter, partial [Aureobasidium melanogenum]